MSHKPSKLIAIILAIILQPFAMLYLGKPRFALVYLVLGLAVAVADVQFPDALHSISMHLSFMFLYMGLCFVHVSYLLATHLRFDQRAWYSRWYGLLTLLSLFVVSLFVMRAFFYEPFKIPSAAMAPTLTPGQTIIVTKWGYANIHAFGYLLHKTRLSKTLNRGDLIVFQYPKQPSTIFVKRIIGVAGDEVAYRKGLVTVNGKALQRNYQGAEGVYQRYWEVLDGLRYSIFVQPPRPAKARTLSVPQGHVFVMGDNRDNSNDSRYWGFLPHNNVLGKVVHVF